MVGPAYPNEKNTCLDNSKTSSYIKLISFVSRSSSCGKNDFIVLSFLRIARCSIPRKATCPIAITARPLIAPIPLTRSSDLYEVPDDPVDSDIIEDVRHESSDKVECVSRPFIVEGLDEEAECHF